jgi:hypothetical protein
VLQAGSASWADDTTAPRARYSVSQLELQAQDIQWPFAETPARFEGSMTVPSKTKEKSARLTFKGTGTDAAGVTQISLSDLALGLAAPYTAAYWVPGVAGKLDAQLDVQWKKANFLLSLHRLALSDVALQDAATASVAVPRLKLLEVTKAEVARLTGEKTAAQQAADAETKRRIIAEQQAADFQSQVEKNKAILKKTIIANVIPSFALRVASGSENHNALRAEFAEYFDIRAWTGLEIEELWLVAYNGGIREQARRKEAETKEPDTTKPPDPDFAENNENLLIGVLFVVSRLLGGV